MVPGANHRLYVNAYPATTGRYLRVDAARFVRVGAANENELIVDNTDAGVSTTGTWNVSTNTGNGLFWGTNFNYASSGSGTSVFTWAAPVTEQGRYRVYARWTMNSDRATNAKYTIHHGGGSSLVTVNQRQNGSRWVLLGTYDLGPGLSHRVELSNDADSTYVIADAIRFVREGAIPYVLADAVKIVPNTAEDALYVHADHLGTPQKMTDASAAIVWDATLRPFGEEDAVTGTATNDNRVACRGVHGYSRRIARRTPP
jgi:hypothetical protein